MHVHRSRPSRQRRSVIKRSTAVLAATVLLGAAFAASPAATSSGSNSSHLPKLVGRAVLPAATLAEGPPSGAFVIPGPGTVRGITFPLPSQPVEGFSSIVSGRHRGEYLAMPDNGFGSKTNSTDFLIRAYYIRPHFKTASGGSGTVDVGDFISFRDPDNIIGFPIV